MTKKRLIEWKTAWERLSPIVRRHQLDVGAYVYESYYKGLVESTLHEVGHALLLWGSMKSSDRIGIWVRDILNDDEADNNEAQTLALEAVVFDKLKLPYSRRSMARYAYDKATLRGGKSWKDWEECVTLWYSHPLTEQTAERVVKFLLTPTEESANVDP